MAGALVLAAGACLAAAVAVAAWLAHARSPGTVPVDGAAVPAAVRRTAGFRLAGVFGLWVLAGVVAGEISVRPAGGRTRTAAVEVRRVRDYLPRRRAARTITGACGILVALPLAGVCLVSAGALLSLSCRPAWFTYAGWALLALLILAVALMGWCAAVLLAPARAAARPAR